MSNKIYIATYRIIDSSLIVELFNVRILIVFNTNVYTMNLNLHITDNEMIAYYL